ncbi:MAG: GNAT family N-acetyltransferase, partial [Nitrososphaerota archaeon]
FQGKGLGTKLTDMLIEIALEKGLHSIYGIVLPENTKMIGLCKKLGFDIKYRTDEVYVELKLKPERIVMEEKREKPTTIPEIFTKEKVVEKEEISQ